jgi:CheY-like chemotaxis protein
MIQVVIVEDEKLLREAIVRKLDGKGIQPIPFESGKTALEYLKGAPNMPDIIWLDYYLKDINGLDFMYEIKEDSRLSKIPVMVVSNSASAEKVSKMLAVGVQKYLLKADYTLDDLIKAIDQILAQVKKEQEQK